MKNIRRVQFFSLALHHLDSFVVGSLVLEFAAVLGRLIMDGLAIWARRCRIARSVHR
jgi:hypothetical protein